MKSCIVLCVLSVAVMALARPEESPESSESLYTSRYDNVNLDEIFGNSRLLKSYVECLLDKGKCSSEGKEIRAHLIEALQNNCNRCTKAQKEGTRRVIKHLINHEKVYWDELCAKYDPDRKFAAKYEKELKEL